MKVLVGLLAILAAAAAQEVVQQEGAQYGLREFIQHLMSLEQKHQQQARGDVLVASDGSPVVQIPDEGVYEIYQAAAAPSDDAGVSYYPPQVSQQQDGDSNFLAGGSGYYAYSNPDKYESAGKSSYFQEVSRPKRQAPSSSQSSSSQPGDGNRLSTFINGLGALTTNIRRQTSDAIRSALRGEVNLTPPRIFGGSSNRNTPQQTGQKQVTSLNDVYGATIGARNSRSRRSVDNKVHQTYAAVIDFDGLRSAVERSDASPQVAFFETPKEGVRVLEEPPFAPISEKRRLVKRSAPVRR